MKESTGGLLNSGLINVSFYFPGINSVSLGVDLSPWMSVVCRSLSPSTSSSALAIITACAAFRG